MLQDKTSVKLVTTVFSLNGCSHNPPLQNFILVVVPPGEQDSEQSVHGDHSPHEGTTKMNYL